MWSAREFQEDSDASYENTDAELRISRFCFSCRLLLCWANSTSSSTAWLRHKAAKPIWWTRQAECQCFAPKWRVLTASCRKSFVLCSTLASEMVLLTVKVKSTALVHPSASISGPMTPEDCSVCTSSAQRTISSFSRRPRAPTSKAF